MRLERGGEGEHFGENRAWCQARRSRCAESWSGECGKQSGRSSGMDSGRTGAAALKQSIHEFVAIVTDKPSFVICLSRLFLPKPFRGPMGLRMASQYRSRRLGAGELRRGTSSATGTPVWLRRSPEADAG